MTVTVPEAFLTAGPTPFPDADGECRPRVRAWRDGTWAALCGAHPKWAAVGDTLAEVHTLANAHARLHGGRPVVVTVSASSSSWQCQQCPAEGRGFVRPSEAALAGRQHWAMKHGQTLVACRMRPTSGPYRIVDEIVAAMRSAFLSVGEGVGLCRR